MQFKKKIYINLRPAVKSTHSPVMYPARKNLGNKKLSVEQTLRKTTTIET